ncbi:Pentatricopeptide repeat-containing protein -mitochondrial [Striga hermonthica]|uniref:Pentatricopeptide repeat-containing protein -mitochondrial n=1 Tax=Striga hermonthica TaxID=68872 RepID=A0A9N7NSV7_STRHE|nr:Pentatricopeptide repeat-containing protein -mitochondrial [Striga hermonthica]
MGSLSTLLKRGFTPTLRDFNKFFLFLSHKRRFKTIIYVFSQLAANEISGDSQTNTIFTKALLKEKKFEEAAEFLKNVEGDFDELKKNRVIDSLIQGLCAFSQDPDKGLSLLKDFLKMDGVLPSSRTFCSLIFCFSRMGKMDRVIELLQLISDDKFEYPYDNFVCSSVISGFVRIGEPELAVGFYENAVKSGSLRPNVVTCTSLVSAYCKLGKIDKVSDLVAWIENNKLSFDVVFYSNWICECFREGLFSEGYRNFRAMVERKVELDAISYTILIDGFSKDGNVEKAVGFLHKMRRDGLEPNLITYTAIILGFCKKGKLAEAFAVLGMLERLGIEADELVYAILINGVCREGDFDTVFKLLNEMDTKGINIGVVTYNTVINGLSKAGRMSEAYDFSKGVIGNAVTYTTLLHGYIKEENNSGILETKGRLEEAGVRMDMILCNILIKSMLMVGLFEDALGIYKGLPEMGLSANSVTYSTLINGFCKAGRFEEALEIFDEFRKVTSNSSSDVCCSRIISWLCENSMVDKAVDFFIEYLKKDLLLARRRKELASASVCYYTILRALMFEGKMLLAQLILTSFVKIYGMSDLGVCKIIANYLCLHDVRKALVFFSTTKERTWSLTIPVDIFEKLTNENRTLDAYRLLMGAENDLSGTNVFHYTIVINALCKERKIGKALDLCTLAKKAGTTLNIVTYNTVINGLCMQGCLVEAFRLFDSLERLDLLPTEVTYGTLIDALVREGLLQDAKMLFERMFIKNLRPGPRIYNSLINGYCRADLLEEALKLFQDLEVKNLEADGFTVSALINGYCNKGDMEGALKLFFELKSRGLLPDFLGFLYLIRGLCAKGRMEESRTIFREMLRIQSIVDLLNCVQTEEVESDSVEKIISLLCERGLINEAVDVLNEVGSVIFPVGRSFSKCDLSSNDFDSGNDFGTSQLQDFDSFYSAVRSLCVKGELAKANRLTKLLMEL